MPILDSHLFQDLQFNFSSVSRCHFSLSPVSRCLHLPHRAHGGDVTNQRGRRPLISIAVVTRDGYARHERHRCRVVIVTHHSNDLRLTAIFKDMNNLLEFWSLLHEYNNDCEMVKVEEK